MTSNGDAADSGAVGVQQAQSGYYTVTALGGTTATAAGAVDEAQAAAGYYTVDSSDASKDGGASDVEPCAAGYYSSAGATVCTQVDAGYFAVDGSDNSVNTAAVAQKACASGYYSSAGATVCTQASAGYYTADIIQRSLEYGSLDLTEEWQTVNLTKKYTNPVVIVSDPSNNDVDSVTTRIKNVISTSFQIRLVQPEAHNNTGAHSTETASFFVGEAGNQELSDGTKFTLGNVSGVMVLVLIRIN